MIIASCHCGQLSVEVDSAPTEVTDCTCSICRRYGVLWAYYRPEQVKIVSTGGATDTYSWGRMSLAFHRCPSCGCVSHWEAIKDRPRDRIGINARLMPLEVLAGARIRHLDGAVTERYLD